MCTVESFVVLRLFLGSTAFAVTNCGALICLGMNKMMEKWVLLEAETACSVTLYKSFVVCGCNNGILRIFNAATLEFIETVELQRHKQDNIIAVRMTADNILAVYQVSSVLNCILFLKLYFSGQGNGRMELPPR